MSRSCGDPSLSLKLSQQVRHISVALEPVTSTAQQLEIADVIGTALGLRDFMIDFHVMEGEVMAASITVPLLLSEQLMSDSLVDNSFLQIGSLGEILPVNEFEQGATRAIAQLLIGSQDYQISR